MTNLRAFLKMIGWSEGTIQIPDSDNGYRALVGGSTFESFEDHPRAKVWIEGPDIYSTAAGRYQILERIFDSYKHVLHLPDFSPQSQDLIAVQLIRECKAMYDVEAGLIPTAIRKCKSRWASFPGANYLQHENKMQKLIAKYNEFKMEKED